MKILSRSTLSKSDLYTKRLKSVNRLKLSQITKIRNVIENNEQILIIKGLIRLSPQSVFQPESLAICVAFCPGRHQILNVRESGYAQICAHGILKY